MKQVTLIARYLLAVMMLVFGLNKFLHFMAFPELKGKALDYMTVVGTTYILPTLGVLYIFSAAMLMLNRAVGLATILLAPLAFNAFMFHLTLDPANIAGAAVWLGLLVVVMIGNLPKYKTLFS